MHVIMDQTGLHEAFSRMVDPKLHARDALHAPAQDSLRHILAGDHVGVSDYMIGPDRDTSFTVIQTATIGQTGIALYGVCRTNAAGREALTAQGLLTADAPLHDRLGPARAAAATRNSTESRRALTACLQTLPADQTDTALQIRSTLPRAPQAAVQNTFPYVH